MTRWVGGLRSKFYEAAVNATQGSVYFFFLCRPPPSVPAARERRAIECGGGVFDSCLPTLPQAVRGGGGGGGGFGEERKANLGRGDNERQQHLEIPEWRCRARIISRVPSSPVFYPASSRWGRWGGGEESRSVSCVGKRRTSDRWNNNKGAF